MEIERTIRAYNRHAEQYAARDVYPLERILARFVELVGGGGLAVDVGCGAGQYAEALRVRGLRVVGLDLSAQMLAQAQLAGRRRLLQADMRRLPLRSCRADGCFVCASLLHIPRPQVPTVLDGFRRVMRPGGVLYVGLQEGVGEEWVDWGMGERRFFVYYRSQEVDQLLRGSSFSIVDGWVSPPGPGQTRRWIVRFAASP